MIGSRSHRPSCRKGQEAVYPYCQNWFLKGAGAYGWSHSTTPCPRCRSCAYSIKETRQHTCKCPAHPPSPPAHPPPLMEVTSKDRQQLWGPHEIAKLCSKILGCVSRDICPFTSTSDPGPRIYGSPNAVGSRTGRSLLRWLGSLDNYLTPRQLGGILEFLAEKTCRVDSLVLGWAAGIS